MGSASDYIRSYNASIVSKAAASGAISQSTASKYLSSHSSSSKSSSSGSTSTKSSSTSGTSSSSSTPTTTTTSASQTKSALIGDGVSTAKTYTLADVKTAGVVPASQVASALTSKSSSSSSGAGSGSRTVTALYYDGRDGAAGSQTYLVADGTTDLSKDLSTSRNVAFAGASAEQLQQYYANKASTATTASDAARYTQWAGDMGAIANYDTATGLTASLAGTGQVYDAFNTLQYNAATNTTALVQSEGATVYSGTPYLTGDGTITQTASLSPLTVSTQVGKQLTAESTTAGASLTETSQNTNGDGTTQTVGGADFMQSASNFVDDTLARIDSLEDQGIGGLLLNIAANVALPLDLIKLGKKITDGRWDEVGVLDVVNSVIDVVGLIPVVGWPLKIAKGTVTAAATVASAVMSGSSGSNNTISVPGTSYTATKHQLGENTGTTTGADDPRLNSNASKALAQALPQSNTAAASGVTDTKNPSEKDNAGVDQQTAESENLAAILAALLAGAGSDDGGGGGDIVVSTGSGSSDTSGTDISQYILPGAIIIGGIIGLSVILKKR